MDILINATAEQLTSEQETFQGVPVKKIGDDASFAIVYHKSSPLKIEEGQWLITYHDGEKEVWNTEQLKDNSNYTEPEEGKEGIDNESDLNFHGGNSLWEGADLADTKIDGEDEAKKDDTPSDASQNEPSGEGSGE